MKNIKLKLKSKCLIIGLLTLVTSCKKFVEVDAPVTSLNSQIIYENNKTAIAALTGIYTNLSFANLNTYPDLNSVAFYTGISSDELKLYSQSDPTFAAYSNNNLTPQLEVGQHFWTNIYRIIYTTNAAIEGLNGSTKLDSKVKNQLLGEAQFVRALCNFYLVNLYGDIPLVISSDYKVNSMLPRTGKDVVYNKIVEDLKNAEALLSPTYLNADLTSVSVERVRPNKFTASALLARVYLYLNKYKEAEFEASSVINENSTYTLETLNNVFLSKSREAIFQLYAVGQNRSQNTAEGRFFILPASGPGISNPVFLTNSVNDSFEQGDQRKTNWIKEVVIAGTHYPYAFKYKIGRVNVAASEYSTLFRLAELYLIRAEARIKQNDLIGGISDLNIIRKRATDANAPLANQLPIISSTISLSQALVAVEHERIVELFTEGHRWLDLKRTGQADVVLKAMKGVNWQSTDQLYPIPQVDIERNPRLTGFQNPGY